MTAVRKSPNPPNRKPIATRKRVSWPVWLAVLASTAVLIAGGVVWSDWWFCLPEDTQATFVGTQSCIQCHTEQAHQWTGSDHDRAMDRATEDSVLGDFNNAELTHFGIVSRMFRGDGKFFVHTEGPEGQMADFEVKYVFGVDPLQQYMVEFDRPADLPPDEIARLQVLRISWDTRRKRWFYLPPPDVDQKLAPDDELHWTGIGQRWNMMCAECHSTNLQKNFDVATKTYHTTFSDIDVGCEACHGPGSVHVKLAESLSPFWDRKRGYGLAKLKSDNSLIQIETCARCHSRQSPVHPDFRPGDDYYDYYANSLLLPNIYYADGQVLDEDYVYGSFIQSKMFHKQIRCTDCHNPHTLKLKHEGNNVCTSCHTHPAGKYDTPAHHHHQANSKGASCAECHMPETTYMEVDPRRDHSLRIPRPDLSVRIGTPNACSRCHIDKARADLPSDEREKFKEQDYADLLHAARGGDNDVKQALARLDAWSLEAVESWFGKKRDPTAHFANVLAAAWDGDPASEDGLIKLAADRELPAMIRASAMSHLARFATTKGRESSRAGLRDPHPLVRSAAVDNYDVFLPGLGGQTASERLRNRDETETIVGELAPLLDDDIRLVRSEAARVLTRVPPDDLNAMLSRAQRNSYVSALDEFKQRLAMNNDRAGSHATLGNLHEQTGEPQRAIAEYRTAIAVEPTWIGARQTLAALLERQAQYEENALRQQFMQARQSGAFSDPRRAGQLQMQLERAAAAIEKQRDEVKSLRQEELQLLERRVRLLSDNPDKQAVAESNYEYGLFLSLHDRADEAEAALKKAHELAPNVPQYLVALAYFFEKYQRWDEAIARAEELVKLRPQETGYQKLLDNYRRQAQ